MIVYDEDLLEFFAVAKGQIKSEWIFDYHIMEITGSISQEFAGLT